MEKEALLSISQRTQLRDLLGSMSLWAESAEKVRKCMNFKYNPTVVKSAGAFACKLALSLATAYLYVMPPTGFEPLLNYSRKKT